MLLNYPQLMFPVLLAMGIASTNLKSQTKEIDDKNLTQAKRAESVKKLADVEYDFRFVESLHAFIRAHKPQGANGLNPQRPGGGVRINSTDPVEEIAALKPYLKQVNFDKQDLVLFLCPNISSHVTGKAIKQDGKPTTILFTYHRGPTKDLRSHFVLFAIDKELKVKTLDPAIFKKQSAFQDRRKSSDRF